MNIYICRLSGYYQYALFSWYKILQEVFVIANKEKDLFINEQIRAKEVMVIGPNGEQLGIKSIKDAIKSRKAYDDSAIKRDLSEIKNIVN